MSKEDLKKVVQHAQKDLEAVGPEVATESQRGWWEATKDWFIDKFVPEVWDMAVQKTAQGAAEISQALNSQANAYVPYGHSQQPLEVEGPQQSYADMIREASQRAVSGQGQDLER